MAHTVDGGPGAKHGGDACRAHRDDRLDLLRGVALVSILVDHIPGDALTAITIHSFGFCDAADIFVFLAGYSATIAYGRLFERRGKTALLRKVVGRCATLYATQAALVLATLVILALRSAVMGQASAPLPPLLNDGAAGIVRGLSLAALPAYLDILPLYVVLLSAFPFIYLALRRSVTLPLALSAAAYLLANVFHLNLPNYMDPAAAAPWTLNPFAWQLVYILGAVSAFMTTKGNALFITARTSLRLLSITYVFFAFTYVKWTELWCGFMMIDDFSSSFFGNEQKCFEAPWRVLNLLALAYLVLTSSRLTAVARGAMLEPILASGRNALPVFAAICLLSLLGRIVFLDLGDGPLMQSCVNAVAVAATLALALRLDGRGHRAPRVPVPSARLSIEHVG